MSFSLQCNSLEVYSEILVCSPFNTGRWYRLRSNMFSVDMEGSDDPCSVKLIPWPVDTTRKLDEGGMDNPNLYYRFECFRLNPESAHFWAEKWLTNALKHMIGLIHQLSVENRRDSLIYNHPFRGALEAISNWYEESAAIELYVKWLEENERPIQWNSTFSFDAQMFELMAILKPYDDNVDPTLVDSDQFLVTKYYFEQQDDFAVRGEMVKVPNYQYRLVRKKA